MKWDNLTGGGEMEHSGYFEAALVQVARTAEGAGVISPQEAKEVARTPRNLVARVLSRLSDQLEARPRNVVSPPHNPELPDETQVSFEERVLKNSVRKGFLSEQGAQCIREMSIGDRREIARELAEQLVERGA